jgi:hypothetical protein
MKRPRIPPILCDIIQTAFSACDGISFDRCSVCPCCGGPVTGYDKKKKHFAVLTDGRGNKTIFVIVKRFRCSTCKKIVSADAPFYPKTRIGSPIVDLCITLGQTMSFSPVSTYLDFLGIVVDRWTVRKYILNNRYRTIATADLFGMKVPMSLFSLTALVASTNEKNSLDPQEVLAACGLNISHEWC